MTEFRLYCRTCEFEREIASLEKALVVETDHKEQYSNAHEVTIERLSGA
jgi:hypothetical protein